LKHLHREERGVSSKFHHKEERGVFSRKSPIGWKEAFLVKTPHRCENTLSGGKGYFKNAIIKEGR
jgi:hypothetical protein